MPNNTLIAAVVNSAVGANKNHLSLFNNGGSVPLEIVRIDVTPNVAAAVTGTGASFSLHRTTAAGTGTAVVIRRVNNRQPSVIPASVGSLSNVTVTPTANSELASLAVSTEEAGNAVVPKTPLFEVDEAKGIDPITLNAGEGVVVRQDALASAGAVNVFIYFRVKAKAV